MTHGTDVLLNRSFLNIVAAGDQYSMLHEMCEHLEEGNGIFDGGEV